MNRCAKIMDEVHELFPVSRVVEAEGFAEKKTMCTHGLKDKSQDSRSLLPFFFHPQSREEDSFVSYCETTRVCTFTEASRTQEPLHIA